MDIYKRMYGLIRPHWKRMAVAMVCMLGVAACTAASAYLIKPVLDDIFIDKKVDMLKILPLLVLLHLSGEIPVRLGPGLPHELCGQQNRRRTCASNSMTTCRRLLPLLFRPHPDGDSDVPHHQ